MARYPSLKLSSLPVPSEHDEQVWFIRDFEAAYPDLRILAIPNAGKRSQRQGAGMLAEGLRPGVPDLFIPAKCLWVEMKRQKGSKISQEQKDWIAYLESIGHRVIVGYGARDALGKVTAVML